LCKKCVDLGEPRVRQARRWLLHANGSPETLWRHDGATGGVIADAEAPQHGLADSGEPVLAPPAAAQSSLSLIRDFPQEHRGFS